jgi:hypothetical protein
MSRHVEIRFASPSCALVSGTRVRELLTNLTGRPPVWSTISRGWVTQPHHARDLVAILEHRGGWEIRVTNPNPCPTLEQPCMPVSEPTGADREAGGLW